MLCKAKRLDGSGEVEGYYYIDVSGDNAHRITPYDNSAVDYIINPKTLKFSFDDGESWYSEDDIGNAIRLAEHEQII